jgi:ABC-type multidrug transport system ATPase subunit
LFAIIARPESNESDRRTVVASFLRRQLNTELVDVYLDVFDGYYQIHQEKQKEKQKRIRRISASSVRVLKICTEINEELTQNQKIIVLFQLLEFAKSDEDVITQQELEFIKTVSETFNISDAEFQELSDFVLNPFEELPKTPNLLIIDGQQVPTVDGVKHVFSPTLDSQIWVLQITSAHLHLIRYMGVQEIYMNSQLLQPDKVYVFNTGASIRDRKSKPIYYSDIVGRYRADTIKDKIVYQALNIEYRFKGGKYGLRDISFEEESGRLVGIMGASGAGKSTLVNVLNGSNPPSRGEVLINGINIHSQKDQVEGIIGHVSQDDLLIEELTVFQNLYYNAKMCFDNYTEDKIVEAVNRVLQNLGLYEIKDFQVGSPLNKKISGGQRKRLNIALELIREPAVLFLDEPTSGLSSRDSENIMDLLKELALKGKLVFVVIHQPSSDIFKMFDSLLILDVGGFSIYYGDPIDSIIYFKSRIHHANFNESECHICGNVNPEQIFNIVESQVLDEYGKATGTRKISPAEWNAYFHEFTDKKVRRLTEFLNIPEISFKIPNKIKQWYIYVKRDILSKLANTQYLVINFLEAPVLAFFLAYLIRYYNVETTNTFGYRLIDNDNLPVYIFMAVIVAIFMGLTVSAEEIIKDRKILKREAFLNLSWNSYLMSKVFVQFVISAIQAFTFVIIGNTILEIKGMYLHYWIMLFSSWTMANMLGLLISDSFKTVVTIYILIPFLVIPQIILSGIIVKYEKLNPAISSPSRIPFYGEIITARWAYEGLAVYQYKENRYNRQFYPFEKRRSLADFKKHYWYNNLKDKVNESVRYYNDPEEQDALAYNMLVLKNELDQHNETLPALAFEDVDQLTPEQVTPGLLNRLLDHLELIRRYHMRVSNAATAEIDERVKELENRNKDAFLDMKFAHTNEQLEEFVTNSGEKPIVEVDGRLYQKTDPIYRDPEGRFLKAHFYAPSKRIFGKLVPTFWANVMVIWFMTIILYIALSQRLLYRLLESIGRISERLFPPPDNTV